MTVDEAYRHYFPAIREKCRRMLADAEEAQDVAQETFVRLWSSGATFEAPAQVLAWAYRTSTRLAVDRIRSRRRRSAFGASFESSESATTSPIDDVHTRASLSWLAERISERELTLVILTHLDGLTQVQAAEVLGRSERSVRRDLVALEQRLAHLKSEVLS